MALILQNSGREPLGQFDCLDTYMNTFNGGEAAVLTTTTWLGTDEAAADVNDDGYIPGSPNVRPAVAPAGTVGNGPPVFLTDDGLNHYGVLFGVVVGSVAGQTSYGPGGGTNLGPRTDAGSGKVTLWDKPGLYGVTLDAVDTASNGLIPNSTASLTVGSAISWTSGGLLTPYTSGNKYSGGGTIGYLTEFATNGSFVTTQQFMVAALNSPSGDVSSLKALTMYQAIFWYVGASA